MRLLDRLFGGFRFYRRLRSGIWEQWYVSVDGDVVDAWFGPFPATFSERVRKIELADSAMLSMARLLEGDREPELEDVARPTMRCIGVPRRVEDHRVQPLVNDKPH